MGGLPRTIGIGVFLVVLLHRESSVKAQEDVTEATTDPIATRNLFRVQPSYQNIDAGGNSTSVLLRTTLWYRSFLIPGVPAPADWYSLFRIDIPLQSLNSSTAQDAGLQDINVIDLVGRPWASITVDGGIGITIPTATHDSLGQGKLQLAPVLAAMVTGVPHARLGFLAQNYFSVAGDSDRPDLDYLSFQPLLSYYVSESWFLVSDATLSFDWKHGGDATLPIDLLVGHSFSSRLAMSLGPLWVTSGSGKNNVTTILRIDYANW